MIITVCVFPAGLSDPLASGFLQITLHSALEESASVQGKLKIANRDLHLLANITPMTPNITKVSPKIARKKDICS